MRITLLLLAAALLALLLVDWQVEQAPPSGVDAAEDVSAAEEAAMLVGPRANADTAADAVLGSPEVEEVAGAPVQPPPDPVEVGTCVLIVRLRGSPTGNPKHPHDDVTRRVDLWRLDAPPNEGWTRGDQLQGHVDIVRGEARFEKLPVGRYRIHAHGQRKGSADPDAFEVHGAETTVDFDVETPRAFPVHVRVFDEYGAEIRSATGKKVSAGGKISHVGRPSWATARQATNPVATGNRRYGGGWGEYSSSRRSSALEWTDHGFALGRFKEETRARRPRETRQLTWPDTSPVFVQVTGKIRKATTYVGATVPVELVHSRILLPDGRRADDAGATISVRCDAQPATEDWGPRDYAEIPIRVHVSLAGYKSLEFTYTLESDVWTKMLVPLEKN